MRIFLLIFCCSLFCVFRLEADSGKVRIGKVIAVDGEVRASNPNLAERKLDRGGAVYLNDTIETGDGTVQIRFLDGTLLNLIPGTEYTLDAYRYRQLFSRDEYSASLVKGGFRSLSGAISKRKNSQFTVKTEYGTMGVEGTVLEASISGGKLYVGCEVGKVIVANEAGFVAIGGELPNRFSVIGSSAERPTVLQIRPAPLNLNRFNSPPGGMAIEQIRQEKGAVIKKGEMPATKEEFKPVKPAGKSSVEAGC